MISHLTEPATNPLRRGLRIERTPEPCVMIIFGASGDLTRRKLIPALYNLALERLLPGGFSVVGFARTENTNDEFREKMKQSVGQFARQKPVEEDIWDSFAQRLHYLSCDFRDAASFDRLKDLLTELDREHGTCCNRVFYLAVPPSSYHEIIGQLGAARLNGGDNRGWTRIIVEKPFGRDLKSARELNSALSKVFREDQIYRIDHYLGKETVQNILVFRFANIIYEPIWNRRYIDHVQITVAEDLGVEGRGGYYEEAGALRDMIQNHLLQLLSLIAIEPAAASAAEDIRDEKSKVLRAVRPIESDYVDKYAVRGQYGKGWIGAGEVPAYREEPGVNPNSTTETYAAVKFLIDNWRWADVPFYLRTGKRLTKRISEIAIEFKKVPHQMFQEIPPDQVEENLLALRIQPDEGMALRFGVKVPGPILRIHPVNMDFHYWTSFEKEPPDAYERLLLDCMLGDSTLFAREDWVETAWSLLSPILGAWNEMPKATIPIYQAGSWGPDAADELIARDGRRWRRL